MHQGWRARYAATEDCANGLMTEADAQRRDCRPQFADGCQRDAAIGGHSGPGRDQQVRGRERFQVRCRDAVVAENAQLSAHLTEVLHQVVCEAVVIVYDRYHACIPAAGWLPSACSIASATACALLSVSIYSLAGSESATMPAPAWAVTEFPCM